MFPGGGDAIDVTIDDESADPVFLSHDGMELTRLPEQIAYSVLNDNWDEFKDL